MSQFSKAALIAAALFLAVPAGSFAQDVQLSLEPPPNGDNIFDAGFTTTVSVPNIVAVNSSMDEAALREVLNGGFMNHVDEVAALTADSITIPEITVSTTTTSGTTPVTNAFTYRDVVLSNVNNGIAESASIGGTESGSAEAKFVFGQVSAKQVDFGSLLQIFGLVDGADPSQPLKTIYSEYTSAGGTFSAEKVSCTLGPSSPAEFRARPLAVSFKQFSEASKLLEASKDNPPAEAMTTVIKFVSDILVAFEASPTSIESVACKGTGEEGKPFNLSVGKISSGGFQGAVFGGVAVDNISVTSDDGSVSLGHAEIKPFDLRTTVAGLSATDVQYTPAYFEQNYRKFIPAWGGFAFSDLALDVPSDNPMAKRVKANIASFDLTLSDYVNGIPSKFSTSAAGIAVPLPQDTADPQVALLLALGLTEINLGFNVSAAWDQANKMIVVDQVALQGANLAGIALAANLGNAAEQLFDTNPEIAQTAALGLTVQGVQVYLRDDGLGNVLAPLAAGPQDKTVGDVRTRLAGLAEGLVLQIFGATDEARALGAAVGNFAAGNAAALTLTVMPKDPAGLSVPVLMQAGENPALLAPMITVTGTAE